MRSKKKKKTTKTNLHLVSMTLSGCVFLRHFQTVVQRDNESRMKISYVDIVECPGGKMSYLVPGL
jgi:hypothetical protein